MALIAVFNAISAASEAYGPLISNIVRVTMSEYGFSESVMFSISSSSFIPAAVRCSLLKNILELFLLDHSKFLMEGCFDFF